MCRVCTDECVGCMYRSISDQCLKVKDVPKNVCDFEREHMFDCTYEPDRIEQWDYWHLKPVKFGLKVCGNCYHYVREMRYCLVNEVGYCPEFMGQCKHWKWVNTYGHARDMAQRGIDTGEKVCGTCWHCYLSECHLNEVCKNVDCSRDVCDSWESFTKPGYIEQQARFMNEAGNKLVAFINETISWYKDPKHMKKVKREFEKALRKYDKWVKERSKPTGD